MGRWVWALILAFFSLLAQAELDPELFANRVRYFEENPSESPQELDVSKHTKTKFVFFKGLSGEVIPFYFGPAKAELEKLTGTRGERDPRKKRVFVLNGSSNKGFAENARNFQEHLDSIVAQSTPDTKLVVVGHSAGAVELWTAIMQNPSFASEKIAGAVFLQGPFGGSPLADFIVQNRKISEVEPFHASPIEYGLRALFLLPYRAPIIRPALQAITQENANRHVENILAENPINHNSDIFNRSLYLGSYKAPIQNMGDIKHPLDLGFNVCVRAMGKITGGSRSDGMVPLSAQSIRGFEARTQVISGYHHGSFQSTEAARSLAKALFSISP